MGFWYSEKLFFPGFPGGVIYMQFLGLFWCFHRAFQCFLVSFLEMFLVFYGGFWMVLLAVFFVEYG